MNLVVYKKLFYSISFLEQGNKQLAKGIKCCMSKYADDTNINCILSVEEEGI